MSGCVCHWCSLRLQYTISQCSLRPNMLKTKKPTFDEVPQVCREQHLPRQPETPSWTVNEWEKWNLLCLSYYPFLFIFVTGASVTLIWIAWARFQQKTLKNSETFWTSPKFWEKKQQKRQFFYGSPETICSLEQVSEVVYLQCYTVLKWFWKFSEQFSKGCWRSLSGGIRSCQILTLPLFGVSNVLALSAS